MDTAELIHKDLSYKIVGLAFEVFNGLGPGHKEKYYQNALEELLKRENISYRNQVYVPLEFNKKIIGKNFIDIIIEDKIVVELKVGARLTKYHFDQTNHYLKHTGHQLGLLVLFSSEGVFSRRVLNIYQKKS